MSKAEEKWNENRTRIPPGRYSLVCIEAGKASIWHEGQGGWGRSEKVTLWFEILEGDHMGKLLPMFLPLQCDTKGKPTGKVSQGSKYFKCWCIANGLRLPPRTRLKEMPPSKFLNKVFDGEVVDVKPKWVTGQEQPEIFFYSRVDILYELVIGNPDPHTEGAPERKYETTAYRFKKNK